MLSRRNHRNITRSEWTSQDKIKAKEVGLRDLGDNLFEPKNINILEGLFTNNVK